MTKMTAQLVIQVAVGGGLQFFLSLLTLRLIAWLMSQTMKNLWNGMFIQHVLVQILMVRLEASQINALILFVIVKGRHIQFSWIPRQPEELKIKDILFLLN